MCASKKEAVMDIKTCSFCLGALPIDTPGMPVYYLQQCEIDRISGAEFKVDLVFCCRDHLTQYVCSDWNMSTVKPAIHPR
jgi:hypothetical protein